jgi:hypothetical protein
MNNELERIWKVAIMAWSDLRCFPDICVKVLGKTTCNPSQDSPGPPEYDAQMLTTLPQLLGW